MSWTKVLGSLLKEVGRRSLPSIARGVRKKQAEQIRDNPDQATNDKIDELMGIWGELLGIKESGKDAGKAYADRLHNVMEDVKKNNPTAPKANPKFKDGKPLVNSDKPGDQLPGLPTLIYYPPIPKPAPPPTSKPVTERDRVIPFSQKNGLADMEWGRLISYPKMDTGLQLWESTDCVNDFVQELHAKDSAEGFLTWLALNNGNVPRNQYLPNYNIYDQSALIIPSNLYNLSGELNWVFGTQSIHDIYANMYSRSLNAYLDGYTLKGIAYQNIAINTELDYTSFDLSTYSESGAVLSLDGVLDTLFRSFTGEQDTNTIKFILENTNQGSIAKAVGANNAQPTLVPDTLVAYTDSDLQALRYHQIQGLKAEIENTPDPALQKLLKAEVKRLENEPIKRYREIHGLGDLIKWSTLSLHELLGDFPIRIQWEGSDILQIGQKPSVDPAENDLPVVQWLGDNSKLTQSFNLSHAIRELMVASQFNHGMTETILQHSTANLIEAGLVKQLVIKNNSFIKTLVEWFGIATTREKKEVPFTFDVSKVSDYREFLKPTQMKVTVDELDVKTEKHSVSQMLAYLMRGTQILEAVHTVSVENKGRWKDYIKAKLGESQSGTETITREDDNGNEVQKPKNDWDDFLEAAELGVIIKDASNPYGKDYRHRPRLTDATKNKIDPI